MSLVAVEKEKGDHVDTIKEKTKEIKWLQKELNAIKNQLHKLRRIVLNYNESHSTKFHLDDVELPKDGEVRKRSRVKRRGRAITMLWSWRSEMLRSQLQNESHFTKFHINDVEVPKDGEVTQLYTDLLLLES